MLIRAKTTMTNPLSKAHQKHRERIVDNSHADLHERIDRVEDRLYQLIFIIVGGFCTLLVAIFLKHF